MTKAEYIRFVRRQYEECSGDLQDLIAVRALGVHVFAWDLLTIAQLDRLYGATRAMVLIWEQEGLLTRLL